MTVLRRVLVALLLTGLLAAWVAPASAEEIADPPAPAGETDTVDPDPTTEDPTPEPPGTEVPDPETEDPTTPVEPVEPVEPVDPGTTEPDGTVTGAVLRWGINNESNNRAFAPGTFNYFSAGKVADPAAGGQTLRSSDSGATWSNGRTAGWSPAAGDVSIEKWDGSTYQGATWAGLSTMVDGQPLTAAGRDGFSGHQIVFGNGVGIVDPNAGTISLTWEGDATVLYYSGMSFFYLSDPTLEVADGKGVLTATLSGFRSSMDDTSVWGPVGDEVVTIATFSNATVTADGVFQATPDYDGVVTTPAQASPGSFPAEFIRFQELAGTAAYWYNSGGAADRFKTPLPVTVLVDPSMLPPAPPTSPVPTGAEPSNVALAAPPARAPRSVTPQIAPVAAEVPSAPAATYQSAGDHGWMLGQMPVSDQLVWWLLAAGLLTMAASTVTASAVYVRRLRPTS